MARLQLKDLVKSYGAVDVIHGVDLDIRSGEFIVFVGPSGCGKSTLLRMVAGLEEITAGELLIDDDVVNGWTPKERGVAMVFQSYALYPHMTVYQNMAFGLTLDKGRTREDIDTRVREAARLLQIDQYLERLPKALSGGQRQRVAIGRAITRDPRVFLFDEPLSNLDAALRVQTRIEIARLHEGMHDTTMIYVTHDQVEAMTLADRIVVLNKGRVEQVGTPLELYADPDNLFVARFIGSPAMNILEAQLETNGEGAQIKVGEGVASKLGGVVHQGYDGGNVHLGVRPEDLTLSDEAGLLAGRVSLVEPLGEVTLVYVDVDGGTEPVIAKLPGDIRPARDELVHLSAKPENLRLFGKDGKALRPTPHASQAA